MILSMILSMTIGAGGGCTIGGNRIARGCGERRWFFLARHVPLKTGCEQIMGIAGFAANFPSRTRACGQGQLLWIVVVAINSNGANIVYRNATGLHGAEKVHGSGSTARVFLRGGHHGIEGSQENFGSAGDGIGKLGRRCQGLVCLQPVTECQDHGMRGDVNQVVHW